MQGIIKSQSRSEKYFEEKCFITEIINTENFASFSLSKAKVSLGITTENHIVKDTDEVYYILSGEGEMEIDGKIVGMVNKDDVVFIPKNKNQRIKNTGSEDLIFICFCSPRFEVKNYSGV
ncbi:MAG: cupin domain-containing protein [Bacteroidia bacterium]